MSEYFWNYERRLEVQSYIESGLSYREIGKKYRVSHSVISGLVRNWNIQPNITLVENSKKKRIAAERVRKCLRCEKNAIYNCNHCGEHLSQKFQVRININPLSKKLG